MAPPLNGPVPIEGRASEVSLILLQPSIGEFGRPRLPVTEEIAGFKSRWEDTLVL